MTECAGCRGAFDDDSIFHYGDEWLCGKCGDERDSVECSDCKGAFARADLSGVDGDLLCVGCVETRADDDDGCPTCAGTGIGQSGPPDSSFCHDCRGGVRRPVRDPDDDDRWRDRDF